MRNDRPASRTTPNTTRDSKTASRYLTIPEVIQELGVPRSTFYSWRQTGKAPLCIKLPNGEIRIRRIDLDAWLASLEEAA